MVELKTNLLTIVIIAGFSVLLGLFAISFSTKTDDALVKVTNVANTTSQDIKVIILNLTRAVTDLTFLKSQELQTFRSGFYNLSQLIYQQVELAELDRNETKANLKAFFEALNKSAVSTNEAIQDLNRDSNASREKQTEIFVETLGQSQNLTKESQQLAQDRNEIEKDQTDKVEQLIQTLNLTLVPNATVVQ
jgi:hypothetical protein